MDTQKKRPDPGTASSKQSEDTNNIAEKQFCLSIDLDCGEIDILEISTPAEVIPFGCYFPHQTGTLREMEELWRQVIMQRIERFRRKKIR